MIYQVPTGHQGYDAEQDNMAPVLGWVRLCLLFRALLRLAGGRALHRATFPAPVKVRPDVIGFQRSRPGAWLLSYMGGKRGQCWLAMGAKGGKLTLFQEGR